MLNRDGFKRGIRIATALALVAAVIASPIRSSRSFSGSSRLRQNLGILLPKPTRACTASFALLRLRLKRFPLKMRGSAAR